MNTLRLATSTFAFTALAMVGTASAQQTTAAIDLRCSDIANLSEAHAAALVYYIAGYQDAQMAAGMAEGEAAPAEDAAPAEQTTAASMPGGVSLSAAAVIAACNATSDMRVADVIMNQGGSGVMPAPATAQPTAGDTTPPAEQPAAEPTTEPAPAPAEGGAPAEGDTPAQ